MESVKKSIDERAQHKREYDSWVNERQIQTAEDKVDTGKAVDASLVNTESIGTESKEQDTSSRSGNDAHADDAEYQTHNDEEPMADVDQNVEQCHDTCPLPAKFTDNQTTELSNQSLESENIHLKKTVAQFQKDFKMEAQATIKILELPVSIEYIPLYDNGWPKVRSPKVLVAFSQILNNVFCSPCLTVCLLMQIIDACITKLLKEVNSRAKVPSNKTTNRNKPVEQIRIAKKPERQIPTRHRFSIKKTSVVHEKTMTPRSCLRDSENLDKMKEKGDACIFVGYSTQSKAYRVFNKRTRMIVETIHVNFDELPQMASDHVSSDLGSQCSTMVLKQDSLSPGPQSQENVPQVAKIVTTSNELELLYSPMFSELLNRNSPVVSKSSAVHAADNPDKRQQHNTTHTSTT
ncbi:hypothetical protein Tco_0183462, partial [Tanacetum coccineum]